jgi:hypothetical protein
VLAEDHCTSILLQKVLHTAKESPQDLYPNGEISRLVSPRRIPGLCDGSSCGAHKGVPVGPPSGRANVAILASLLRMEGVQWSKPSGRNNRGNNRRA